MEEKKIKGLKFNLMLIMFAMIPMMCAIITLIIVASISAKSSMESETKETLRVASNALKLHYQQFVSEGNEIPYEHDYVDSFKAAGVELTVFIGDTRYMTSILDSSNQRIEGTKAGDAVIAAVLNSGQDYYSNDVKINNTPYFVYYMPIIGADGKPMGMAFAGKTCTDVNSATTTLILTSVFFGVLFAVCFVILTIILSRKVAKPLGEVTANVTSIADGSLADAEIDHTSIVESKMLIESAKKLQKNLNSIIGKTKGISSELVESVTNVVSLAEQSSESANQISGAMEDLAAGATSMAENVQNINEQVIEMGGAIGDISDNVDRLSASSENIKTANSDATTYMNKVSESSAKSVDAVNDITRQINETNDAISKIDEAVSMIASVAKQTNLLALNASIEAARAGDAGRGFAVVATEISSLSDQSNASANQIKMIVQEIVEQSANSVRLSAEVADVITEEQGYIVETQSKFNLLNEEIQTSLEEIASITTKTKVLDNVKTRIIDSVQDLSAISEENAASNQEVSASIDSIAVSVGEIKSNVQEVNNMAAELEESVSYFS